MTATFFDRLVVGDGLRGMAELPNACADLVLCDLPSGETNAGFDVPIDLALFWDVAWRALTPTGAVVLMASSIRFASVVLASQPKTFRHDLVWSKNKASGFFNARKAPLRAHEFVLVFWRKPGCYAPDRDMTYTGVAIRKHGPRGTRGANYGPARSAAGIARIGATDRFPTSVLTDGVLGNTSRTRIHAQQKPAALLGRLIRRYCPPGGLVLDPCVGSGATVHAALAEGRHAIGWDLVGHWLRAGGVP